MLTRIFVLVCNANDSTMTTWCERREDGPGAWVLSMVSHVVAGVDRCCHLSTDVWSDGWS